MKVNTINLLLSCLTAFANAESWKFNVVSIKNPNYDIGLKYNNEIIKMNSEIFPLFTTTIESNQSNQYKYVVLDKEGNVVEEENINRTYTNDISLINEVYNRETRTVKISSLPKVYDPVFNSGTKKYQPYDDNQIYTLYAKCDDTVYNSLKHTPYLVQYSKQNKALANCTINFITKDKTYQRTGTAQLIGFDSRKYKKLSWKFKLDKKILGRKSLKFRGNANDPTLMRDKLTTELLKSVGVPTYSSAYARVMINDDVYGLYNIVDTLGGNFLSSIIHGNDDAHTGTSYKCFAGAHLKYLGETKKDYSIGSYQPDEIDANDVEANGNLYYRLARFAESFQNWIQRYQNDQSDAAIQALEQFFHLESLLRQMVVESLIYAYDNFWANSGNFALYYNPEQSKYQIIPYDFDGTFYGSKGSKRFSKDYLSNPQDCINWADLARKDQDNYFIGHLFEHHLIRKRYNEIMEDTLNTAFNVDTMSTLIDSIANLIEPDVEWNYSLIELLDTDIPGYINRYTIQNFRDNTNYKKVKYDPTVNRNDAHFGLKEWIKQRSSLCNTYVDNEKTAFIITTTTTTTTTTTKATTTTTKVPTTTTTTTTKGTTTTTKLPTTTTTTTTKTTTTTTKLPTTITTTTTKVVLTTTTKKITTTTKKSTKKTVKKSTKKSTVKVTKKIIVKTTKKKITKTSNRT